ncbi:MAG: sialate O-acetylesterase, partial [Fibrobacterota bacterium]
ASPGEKISAEIDGSAAETVSDPSGKWQMELPPLSEGGPYSLKISTKDTAIEYGNIMSGEVWICSGQSNMRWTVENSGNAEREIKEADYPGIRLYVVPDRMEPLPAEDIQDVDYGGNWKECSPSSVKDFSAVAYYFGRELHKATGVPVGLILSAWGGTEVKTWMPRKTASKFSELNKQIKEMDSTYFHEDQQEIDNKLKDWEAAFKTEDSGISENKRIWAEPSLDDSSWDTVQVPENWEKAVMKRCECDGVIWYRKTINIESDNPGESKFTLSLGPVDDTDEAFINGVKVGGIYRGYTKPRVYKVPAGTVKPGRNVITLRCEDYDRSAGMWGKKEQIFLSSEDFKLPLHGEWKYKKGYIAKTPKPQKQFGPNSFPSLLYNGMINPVAPFLLKGVIWYQGESDVGVAEKYYGYFSAMIKSWRKSFKNKGMPFLFVQLANYMDRKNAPSESRWADLREAQLETLTLPNTGMAVTIDIGEAKNIHPANKQEVGRRLCIAALKKAYGIDTVYTGPLYESHSLKNDKMLIKFTGTGSGLVSKNEKIKGFSAAGPDGEFKWAEAEIISENSVLVSSSEIKKIKAVRYGWADNPEVSLYNKEGLPASPFRTDK